MELRSPNPEDMGAVLALLAASDLPTNDLPDPAIDLFLAYDDGALVGVVGLQPCSDGDGLLRSLAVVPARRGRGVAAVLCEQVARTARERGVRFLACTRPPMA